ncbi:ATP adenylyltransferase [Cyanobacterium stanieri PCC 7202]|uniref:ATP adenylyltransferase n=1 Tax=Cyanobacterium stanieri (strain ATCC 29140 / PCC 7202) TaxID=292563 RepID=K9YJU5_CYASC|nr:ATP adenylyltransferase [Cyanobacterium stanieri PCC 7202]
MGNNNLDLWSKINATTINALQEKALKPIETKYQFLEEQNINFIVRILDNIQRKENAKKKQKKKQKSTEYNPFLPYEEKLYVDDLGDSHVCILNKYNVVNNHVLIITKDFEPQENLLNINDLEAFWMVLKQVSGLGFYNAGAVAGASQPHKHLQVIPFPLAPNSQGFPMENLVLNYRSKLRDGEVVTVDELPYLQAIAFTGNMEKSAKESAKITKELYHQMLEYLSIENDGKTSRGNYNLLVTKQWMMMIPRTQPKAESISINSLGFAGALLVKNEEQLEIIKQYKPLHILKKVGIEK